MQFQMGISMGDGFKAFWLGLFIVITVAVAAWLLLFLRPTVGDCGKILKVRFSNIQNVAIGTRVTFGGKPVGEVVKINEVEDARSKPSDTAGNFYFYELDLCVDSKVKVYSYDEIVFSTQGLLGEKSIAILAKAAPPGMPPAHEISSDVVLYARSTDDLQETLTKLTDVAEVFESAMERFNEFLDENMEEFHSTVIAVGEAASSLCGLVNEATETDFIGRMGRAADSLASAMATTECVINDLKNTGILDTFGQLARGEGTLGRLLTSDCFYLQVTAMMCKLETVLNDISNYGLLFQYDRKWQRKRLCKERAMEQLSSPREAVGFFNTQVCEITNSLDRIERLLYQMETRCDDTDPCFAEGFRELMGRVENLMMNLKNYRELLFEEYCEACH